MGPGQTAYDFGVPGETEYGYTQAIASLLVDVRYFVLGVMTAYRHKSIGKSVTVASDTDAKATLDAVYASGRLQLPFQGLLLFGY
jgi:hypothetical protein